MDNPLISIIIPVYNTEKYLKRCINSVLNQSYENLEIILVNDGSTDGSGAICEEYTNLDKRVIVINKENGGASSARNVALKIFSGEYVAFVDSDDFVNTDYILHMYNLIIKNECDIVQTDFVSGELSELPDNHDDEKIKIVDKYYCLSGFEYKVVVWGKLYKAEILKGSLFPEGMIYEDDATYYKFVNKSKRICLSSKKLYYYYLTEVSVMRNNKIRLEFFEIYKNRIAYFMELNEEFLVGKSYERYAIILILYYSDLMKKKDVDNYKNQVWEEYINIFKDIVKFSEKKYKILFYAFRIMPNIVANIISLVRKNK